MWRCARAGERAAGVVSFSYRGKIAEVRVGLILLCVYMYKGEFSALKNVRLICAFIKKIIHSISVYSTHVSSC